ncbi:MAG: trigger factor [Patescibacteria group bacterium]|nr:trigger factor [Patescibacteria group bacterium]
MKTTIKKLEKSEIEITGSIPASEFEAYENDALESIGKKVEIKGFRKGKAPLGKIKENTDEMMLLEEMAEHALYAAYPKILEENKIDAIGRPQVSITKITKGSDLEFRIVTAVLPKVDLPDYKKISKEQIEKNPMEEVIIEDKEVEKVLEDLRKMRAQQNQKNEEGEGGKENKEDLKLPEINDEFIKSFGDFKSVDDFKAKIKDNLKKEKELQQKDKQRLAVVEEIIKETKVDIPDILIEAEINKILQKLEADVTAMGLKFDDYLKQVNKTSEDLTKEWKGDAEKRAKLQVIIHAISEKENLKAEEGAIQKEVDNITKTYKDADPARAKAYVEQMLTNEKVFEFLEN